MKRSGVVPAGAGGSARGKASPPASCQVRRNAASMARTAGPWTSALASSHGTWRHDDSGVSVTSSKPR